MRGTPSAALATTTSMKGNLQMITSFHSHRAIRSKNGFSIWGFYASWAENDLTCSNCVSVRYTMSHTTEIVLSWNRFWFLFWEYEMSTFIRILKLGRNQPSFVAVIGGYSAVDSVSPPWLVFSFFHWSQSVFCVYHLHVGYELCLFRVVRAVPELFAAPRWCWEGMSNWERESDIRMLRVKYTHVSVFMTNILRSVPIQEKCFSLIRKTNCTRFWRLMSVA